MKNVHRDKRTCKRSCCFTSLTSASLVTVIGASDPRGIYLMYDVFYLGALENIILRWKGTAGDSGGMRALVDGHPTYDDEPV
jgi:hypothetical protein